MYNSTEYRIAPAESEVYRVRSIEYRIITRYDIRDRIGLSDCVKIQSLNPIETIDT